jgi:flagellar assembly protein FliH
VAKRSFSKIVKSGKDDTNIVRPFLVEDIEGPLPYADKIDSLGYGGGRASKIEREAYEKGFRSGEEAGMEMGRKKMELQIQKFSEILEELTILREKIFLSVEENILELALAVARKVIHHEVRSEREVAINVVKAALKAAILSEKVTIKLNPLDLDTAVEHKADLMDHIDGSPKVKLEKDEGVGQGGCVIETAYGNIDARLEEQMAEVEKVLEKELTV